jgi:hypothetical protein
VYLVDKSGGGGGGRKQKVFRLCSVCAQKGRGGKWGEGGGGPYLSSGEMVQVYTYMIPLYAQCPAHQLLIKLTESM